MNGTLQTMNGRRYRGEIEIDPVTVVLTGVAVPLHVEIVGLPVRTLTIPWSNVSHIDWDTDACES